VAAPRDARRYPKDLDRPLTREGIRKMVQAARGMKALGLSFDLILTSPLARARETAQIVAAGLRPRAPLKPLPALAPDGDPSAVALATSSLPEVRRLLLVGHEPALSRLAGFLVLGRDLGFPHEFKKGGMCRIDFAGAVRPGAGKLMYLLPPKVLRACAPRTPERAARRKRKAAH
jgi:phosphohistidine phosphatase